MSSSYKGLMVWQKSMDLTEMVYKLVKKLPREELFEMASQMRRCAVSIPSNIAEGQSRNSHKEFIRFLSIAKGSCAELETQLILGQRIKYFKKEEIIPILDLCSQIGKMINSLQKNISLLVEEPVAEYGEDTPYEDLFGEEED